MNNLNPVIKKVRVYFSNFLFSLIILLFACESKRYLRVLSGKTMGTTYTVKIVDDTNISIIDTLIHSKIDSVLVSINQQMSTFIPTSEISIFNQSDILQIYPSNEFRR